MDSNNIHLPEGKRLTKPKQLILDYFNNNRDHVTADGLFRKIKPLLPQIGIATVYRNLNDLASLGILKQLSYPGMPALYELADRQHAHFYCEYCHQIYDVSSLDKAIEANRAYEGHYIKEVNVELKGLCKKCMVDYFG